jgi:hypothetical protein
MGRMLTPVGVPDHRPPEYEQAIQHKENARADIALADSERTQALTAAQTVLQSAYISGE